MTAAMMRRLTFFILLFSMMTLSTSSPTVNATETMDVWLGTNRAEPSRGIYHCTLNLNSGKLSQPALVAEMKGPGFLAMHPDGKHLYAVGGYRGTPSVVAFEIERSADRTKLNYVNSLAIGDGGAAHVAIDPSGRTLLTAQYGGGSVAAFSLNKDGSLNARTVLIEHEGGSGVVAGRQENPHPHWVGFSPDNRFAFVPDLGLDRVMIYRHDADSAMIAAAGAAVVPPGSGPRHMKFHTSGKWVYVLNELTLSVSVFDYEAKTGQMTSKQTVLTVPVEELEKEKFKSASEIRVHPSGKFVYAANRGHDTITVFKVDPEDGRLSVVEVEPIRGATPRNFNLDPSGKWLLAAGQDSHTLACFEVDLVSGELTYSRNVVFAPSAICVMMSAE